MLYAVIPGMSESRIIDKGCIRQQLVKVFKVILCKHTRPSERVGEEVLVAVGGKTDRH